MKSFRKTLALLLALCLIVAVCPVMSAYAEENGDIISDDLGGGFSYVYNKYHAFLVVHGSGPLVLPDPQPWDDYKGDIRRIVLDEGITSIPAGAFSGCDHLASVVFPVSLEKIDSSAFSDCGLVSYATTTGSTTSLRGLLKDAGIDAFRVAAFTRVNEKNLAEEISDLESVNYNQNYYLGISGEKLTLEQIKWKAFMDSLINSNP